MSLAPDTASLRDEDYQDPDDLARVEARRRERKISEAVLAGLIQVREVYSVELATAAIQAGNFDAIKIQLSLSNAGDELQQAFDEIADTYQAVASRTAADMGYRFDRLASGTVTDLQNFRQNMLTELGDSMVEAAQNLIVAGLQRGVPPNIIASDLAEIVGLSPSQAVAIQNYRGMLERNDLVALTRVNRNPSFDQEVRRHAVAAIPLGDKRIDVMVSAYVARYLASRADGIAGTDASRAANLGRAAAVDQAIDQGGLDASDVRRFWRVTLDERTCPFCISVPLLNPAGVALDQPYLSIDGPVDGPWDSHPICRCSETHLNLSGGILTVQNFARIATSLL